MGVLAVGAASGRIAFYADHDFSSNLVDLVRGCGADVLRADEDGYSRRPDAEVMDRATELARVLLSHDAHMLAEARRRQQSGTHFSGLIRIHQRHRRDPGVRDDLSIIAEIGERDEYADRVEYLPWRG